MRRLTRPFAILFAATAGLWAAAAETYDPVLSASELPVEIVHNCVPSSGSASEACLEATEFDSRWVGRGRGGSIFIVMRPGCSGTSCRAWLVEKSAHGVRSLLGLNGQYRLSRDQQGYPVIQVRSARNENRQQVSRYEWKDGRYVRTETLTLYRVDGIECGTRQQCRDAAREAFRQRNIDRGVKIYERVHGVSWI